MTVGQAAAANRILEQLLDSGSSTLADVLEAGALLARHAHRTLLAGINEEEWREKFLKRSKP